ncbi:hypothetical protein HF257_26705 [Pseudomonas sp. WS 5106]|uniref:Dermonecrotic toxin N-terminal domain-containing protein n=1 Tax=Pseudomonas cremoris TaxID=2724178 RepID=A0A7X1E1I2_9PSED|nr:DUF6543 domain-containing protein [Pseudomonas cremoris]MBC2383198.1 hypothetical protein [Pseudomonas cremoris]MBC2409612.1 hypothetical protein [Pseudomonas cremoris]
MTTEASLSPSSPSLYQAQVLRRYFLACPSLQDVAIKTLQRSLGERYRWLIIDQTQPVLMEPLYRFDGKAFKLEGHNSLTVVDALIERCATGKFVDYSQGQFLVQKPDDGSPIPLHVQNSDLEQVINQRGATLLEDYREALVDYWMARDANGMVRFIWLAEFLKNALLLAAGSAPITHEQLDMIIDVAAASRPTTATRAYIVDQWGESGAANLEMLRGLVIVRQRGNTTIVLLFTLARGIQVFDSLQNLGDGLVSLLSDIAPGHQMQWRLYAPEGNIFYSFSLTFLAKQLSDIRALLPLVRPYSSELRVLERALRVVTGDFDTVRFDSPRMARLRAALPRWLLQAPPQLQMDMARYTMDLAATLRQPGWKPFDEGIASLEAFATSALSAQITKDFPHEPALDPTTIKLQMGFDEPDRSGTVKPFWSVPPLLVQVAWTLPAFAWLGLSELDPERLSLAPGEPEGNGRWLTVENALSLVANASIGAGFAQLIVDTFKDQAQADWRKARFIEQLRLQLPMLALEYHLKYPQAFSAWAYNAVVAVVAPRASERKVNEQTIVLRPLAFKTSDGGPDCVNNMFVIGPLDVNAGRHLLYRPMAQVKLIEFSSWDAILSAIRQPGPLQYQVLAWMTEPARSRYLAPGLPTPGPQMFQFLDFNVGVWTKNPVILAQDVVQGDYLEALFVSAVQSMSGLEPRQSLTGMERLWDWIKRHFGLGLALILSLYGGPAGEAAGWLLAAWAIVQDVSQLAADDTQANAGSIVDLLLNIGLILLSRGRISTAVEAPVAADTLLAISQEADFERSFELGWSEPAQRLTEGGNTSRAAQERLPTEQTSSLLVRGDVGLEQTWSGLYSRLSVIRQAELALYRVRVLPYAQRIHTGNFRGLYRANGNMYVDIAGDWFKVEEHDGVVRVVSDEMATREGPALISAGTGLWGFAPEPKQPEDLKQALQLEQLRLGQLKSDEQRRIELDLEYDTLTKQFDSLVFTDNDTLEGITRRFAEPGSLALIDDELFKADASHWCATTLLDALVRRRQLLLVRDFSALSNSISAGAVKARRVQVTLYGGKRNVMLMHDLIQVRSFDASKLTEVVLTPATLRQVAARLPDYALLQHKAIDACLEAEQRFEEMKHHGRLADTSVAALDLPTWTGRRISLKWQELQLRTLALMCFDSSATCYRDTTLDLIQDVSSLCSLKLLSRRELFTVGRFNLGQQLRVLNDVLDALVLANSRLSYQLGTYPRYINAWAMGNYRSFMRSLLEDLEADLIAAYRVYEAAPLMRTAATGSKKIIDDALAGLVVGNWRSVVERGEPQEYVDVLEPFDHRSVWSFKRMGSDKEPVWQEVPKPQPVVAPDVPAHEHLADIGGEANRLWRIAGRQFDQITSLEAIPRMSPRRVRSEWVNFANKMIRQRDLLIDALKVPAASARHQDLLEFFKHSPGMLYNEIVRFQEQANLSRKRMIMRSPPSSENLLILYKSWLIDVVEVATHDPLARRFEIRESATGRPFWEAHFTYDGKEARDVGYHFSQGLLKRFTERGISYEKLKRRATNPELLINVLRSNIDHEVAETVFFTEDVEPTSA